MLNKQIRWLTKKGKIRQNHRDKEESAYKGKEILKLTNALLLRLTWEVGWWNWLAPDALVLRQSNLVGKILSPTHWWKRLAWSCMDSLFYKFYFSQTVLYSQLVKCERGVGGGKKPGQEGWGEVCHRRRSFIFGAQPQWWWGWWLWWSSSWWW